MLLPRSTFPRLAPLASSLPLFLALSCSDVAEPTPLTRDVFCERWAEAACQDEVVSVCQASSPLACQVAQEDACLDWLPSVIRDENVDACMAAVADAYADADLRADELDLVLKFGEPCNRIVANRAGGDECSDDEACDTAAGQRCILKDLPLGTCEVPELVEAGFPCDEPQQTCEAGFFCDGQNCLAALGTGEECVNHSQCDAGSFCDGSCETQRVVGADCEQDFECAGGICYTSEDGSTCTDRIRLSPAEPLCDDLR
jgi:hypothetical protein